MSLESWASAHDIILHATRFMDMQRSYGYEVPPCPGVIRHVLMQALRPTLGARGVDHFSLNDF